MMTVPLTVTQLFRHGQRVHGQHEVVTWHGDHATRRTFAQTAARVEQFASALDGLGVGPGDVVATFMWNDQAHLEAYWAVPCKGAVLHTLNIRLFPEQLAYVLADGGAKVVLVHASLVPALAHVADQLAAVEHVVLVDDLDGAGDTSPLGRDVLAYEQLLAAQDPGYDWPDVDEHDAAMMCHTSGTTGNPKGVVYSHRSQWTHAMGANAGGAHIREGDRALVIVPQFHANAWGLVYISWVFGADVLQPGAHLQPDPLAAFIEAERPTTAYAVPTVWNGLLALGEQRDLDLSSLDRVVVGGSAVPRSMIRAFKDRYDVDILQGWGMTEMSPLGTIATPPASVSDDDLETQADWRAKTGRIIPGVDMRIVDDAGDEQPWDGRAIGEVQVRGPWITGSYHGGHDPEKFSDDGWLRTGDVAVIEPGGYMQIVDRSKDVIKSGGEWISSVDLENAIVGHPDVLEAAVIAVQDDRWDERPLACVVLREGATVTPTDLSAFLAGEVVSWWIPERWAFIDEVPKTSVGKYDKKVLRGRHEAGGLRVELRD
jgi:fatty-acyl-CoA synthase